MACLRYFSALPSKFVLALLALAALPVCLRGSAAFAGSSPELFSSLRASWLISYLLSNVTVMVASVHLTPDRPSSPAALGPLSSLGSVSLQSLFSTQKIVLDLNLQVACPSCLSAIVSFVAVFQAPRRKLGPCTHKVNIC